MGDEEAPALGTDCRRPEGLHKAEKGHSQPNTGVSEPCTTSGLKWKKWLGVGAGLIPGYMPGSQGEHDLNKWRGLDPGAPALPSRQSQKAVLNS